MSLVSGCRHAGCQVRSQVTHSLGGGLSSTQWSTSAPCHTRIQYFGNIIEINQHKHQSGSSQSHYRLAKFVGNRILLDGLWNQQQIPAAGRIPGLCLPLYGTTISRHTVCQLLQHSLWLVPGPIGTRLGLGRTHDGNCSSHLGPTAGPTKMHPLRLADIVRWILGGGVG